ncbi:MAG: hypothetical protein ACJ765_04750 [Chloroflexota bacterium]|jgi:hypothetical protein
MRSVRPRPLLGALLAGVLALAVAPTVVAAPTSSYQLDLGRRNDYVGQTNLVQCVGASMQMMLNMMSPRDDRTASTQLRLQKLARAWSGPSRFGRIRKGASVRGWAKGLTIEGGGPYQVVGKDTIQEALLTAARAMRTTERPVGLLVWRGRHAWVMSGFRATKDPLLPGARVTAAIVEDPLHPFGDSTTWGRSPRPGEALSIGELSTQFVRRRQSTLTPSLSGKFVVVLPFQIDPRTLRLHGFPAPTAGG